MDSDSFKISGNIVDVINSTIFGGEIEGEGSTIVSVRPKDLVDDVFIMPGFVDSHIHIESSMLTPFEFAKAAFRHGTVACVSDPHEIANVVGIEGVKFMIENGRKSGMKFYFGAPSCVPATNFETSGATLSSIEIESLLKMDNIKYLSEMMNYPGVLNSDIEVLNKLNIAKRLNKRIDGHAPGLTGMELRKYVSAGISTDHECTSFDEAIEKIQLGMSILIREGSSAKNFEGLWRLIDLYPDKVMLCSDDLHPNDLMKGHLNLLIKRGLHKNIKLFNLLKAGIINPIRHYDLDIGLLRVNEPADFIIVNNLKEFNINKTYINGKIMFSEGFQEPKGNRHIVINQFKAECITLNDIAMPALSKMIKVIEVIDKKLITKTKIVDAKVVNGLYVSDIEHDILKIIVYNRYKKAKPSVAFITNFGLKRGAIAGSIAHDSHNIIAIGANDPDIVQAINKVINDRGGIVCSCGEEIINLPLEIGGLMSSTEATVVAKKYEELDQKAKDYGSHLTAPFMTLSFMALLVIPELKISDKGLFDGLKFKFTSTDVN